jgi:hypothetical protein
MEGMRVIPAPDPELGPDDPCRVIRVDDGVATVAYSICFGDAEAGTLLGGDLPDLSDPATLGCVEHIARDAWADPLLYVAPSSRWHRGDELWLVWRYCPEDRAGWREIARGATRADALVAALENAPALDGGTP